MEHVTLERPRLLQNLGIRGLDYAWAIRTITQGLARNEVPAEYRRGNKPPVLILPGVLENWTMMRSIADRLNKNGHPIHVLLTLKRNTVSIETGAELAEDYLRDHNLSDVLVVAHSKGGLIAKQLLSGEASDRVRKVITIATPYAGSSLATWFPSRTIRALRPSDPTILRLSSRTVQNDRIVSIFPRFDPHIPSGSSLLGATNVPVSDAGHFRILDSSEVIEATLSAADY
ncbi:alpha/beta hydrolase [Leucobacter viscericola]|uniref:Alpha/beta hydrolase n=1 Tax=Leucobacter viscericola TaxID=2714935 RepID=A0A6G7XCN6_9MICO|nr:alpha/beta hydrolase [Leucobacter viscericola]QIK62167.1 alpha/beta hydrolase [Leucobacter viscericola]